MKDLFERRPRPTSTGEGTAHSDSGSSSRPNSLHSPPHLPRGTRFKQHEPPGNFSDDDLEDMWDDALNDYFARTGMDLSDRDQDLYRRLQRCSSSESVARTLDEIALEFRTYRKGSRRAAKIRSVLSSVAHGVSNLIDAGAESAASKAFPGGKAVFVAIAVLIRATQGVSKHFDTLLAILDKFGFYLSRLRIRLHVGLGPESRRITVELLSKMVHAFALATETMHHNRLHHFVNVLFNKDDEVGIVGQRVSQLMEEDSRMDLVEIHRAVSNLSDEMDKALARA
ncbi:hypothetical protein PENSPDRAFT_28705 [Peniophora sp. CONT]|nr:hypothetical protein PENSPDRAFT_28705 [Peniophora sp. CONT]